MDIARGAASGSGIEAFRKAVEADPLFAAEGMDVERAKRNVTEVSRALRELERAFAAGSFLRRVFLWRYPLGKYAVPLSFVRSFIESERARRAFLADPTVSRARALLERWQDAARHYVRCVARYRTLHDILRAADPDGDTFQFQDMFGNVSDIDYIERTLDAMEKNGAALIKEVGEYGRLLSGIERAKGDRAAREEPLTYETGTLTPEAERLLVMQVRERMPFVQSDVLETYGPLRYSIRHFDGAATPHLFNVYVLRNKKTGLESMHVALIDDFYFLKITGPDADFGGLGRANFEELIELGIPYWHQNATAFYTMRDQMYWADIATIADMARRPDLDQRHLQKERSSMFDLMLGSCAFDILGYVGHTWDRHHKDAFSTYSFLYGLLMRSHPSVYYLPFNRSVWRLPEPLDILGDRRLPKEKVRYRPLRDVLPVIGEDVLGTVMQGARLRSEARRKKGIAAGI
ncbi:MAG: hypothetical protein WC050_00940 [Candidatus Paceibacterota bacterium]